MFKKLFMLLVILLFASAFAEDECNHVWSNYESASSGSHTKVCSVCGQTAMEAHSLETIRENATCVTAGSVTYVCTRCGYSTEPFTDTETKGNHVWGSVKTVTEPTCAAEGKQERTCTLCGTKETISVPATGHNYGAWSSQDDYWHVRKCASCGETDRERHDSAVARTITYAKETRLGKKSFTCTACNYMYTRLYSATNSKLYTAENQEIEGYIYVGSIEVKAGNSCTVHIYPESSMLFTANSSCEFEIYANAETLEYKGFVLKSGDGMLTCNSGDVQLEFISCEEGASLLIDVADNSLSTDDTVVTRATNGHTILTRLDGDKADMHVYKAKTVRVNGEKISCQWESVLDAEWSYNATAGRFNLALQQNGYIIDVYAGGKNVFNGTGSKSYESAIPSAQLAEGWYVAVTGNISGTVYASPMFNWDGSLMGLSAEEAAFSETEANKTETESDTEKEPEEVSEVIEAGTSFEVSVHKSPDITVSVENGKYTVKIGTLTAGWTLDHISFVQTCGNSNMKISNAFTSEAVYEYEQRDGRITAYVYLYDGSGKSVVYTAGSYECCF